MATRWIVVDDLDTSITYEGPWTTTSDSFDNVGNFGPTYLSTLHGLRNGDGSLSFPFNGSAIMLLGTNDLRNSSGILDPTWDCLIDGVSFGPTAPFQFAENNWVFCDWKSDADGRDHILTVNAHSNGQTFWVDRIQYLPSKNAQVENPVVLVDRHDPAIHFDSGWGSLGGAANYTMRQGSTATIEFIGTRLSWWGFIPTEQPHRATSAAFAVDGQTLTSFPLRGISSDGSPTIYNQMFFQTPVLGSGPHRIMVVYQGNGETTPLTLTNLLIEDGNYTSPNPDDPSIFTPTGDPSPSATASAVSRNKAPIGAIVGGVLGGLVMIAITILVGYYLHRKRKNRQHPPLDLVQEVQPYTDFGSPPPPTQMYYQHHTPSHSQSPLHVPTHRPMVSQSTDQFTYDPPSSPSHTDGPQPPILHPEPLRKGQMAAYATTNRTYTSPTDSSGATTRSTGSRVVRHEDSGIRLGETQEDVVEVPPLYTVR